MNNSEFSGQLHGAVKYEEVLSLPARLLMSINELMDRRVGEQKDFVAHDYTMLGNVIHHVMQTLPPSQQDEALQPVSALITGGRVASHEEIEHAVGVLSNRLLSYELSHAPLRKPTAQQLKQAGTENIPTFVRGKFGFVGGPKLNGEERPDMAYDEFKAAFSGANRGPTGSKADLVIFEGAEYSGASRSLEFHCDGADRSKWTIEVEAKEMLRIGSDTRSYKSHTSTLSFIEWQKANPEAAMYIEPELARLQEIGRQKDAADKARDEAERQRKMGELDERGRLLLQTKQQPGVWLPYPRAFDVLTKGDVPYEFVCYSPAYENGKGAYLFLQTPDRSNPNTPAIRKNSPTE